MGDGGGAGAGKRMSGSGREFGLFSPLLVFFFFCKSGLFQRQTYVQPIRGWFERGWRRRDSFVSLRYYNLLTPIVHFWRVSVACQASLVEPFVFWQDMVEPKCLPRDQTSLICRQSVREGCE